MEEAGTEFVDQVLMAVKGAEVLSIFFPRVGRSLILDSRRLETDGPAVILDGMVESPEARLQSFQRLRPGLPLPTQLTLAPWPGAVRVFAEFGLLDAFVGRCRDEGGEELAVQASEKFEELRRLERDGLRSLVRGNGMYTIWKRENKSAAE
jgi:hypothetical protein